METTSGTKEQVFLTDTLNTNRNGENRSDYLKGGKYLESSFELYKVDASGTKTKIMPVPVYQWTTDSNGYPRWSLARWIHWRSEKSTSGTTTFSGTMRTLTKCPAASVSSTTRQKPRQGTWWPRLTHGTPVKIPRIEKKGQYDPNTGRIQWTITVKVPHSLLGSYLLQGSKITDSLPDGVQIVGDVKVGNTTISAEEFRQNGYTIPENYSGTELKITFETTTPLGGGSVTNKAQMPDQERPYL